MNALEEKVGCVRHPAYLVSPQGSRRRVARRPWHNRVAELGMHLLGVALRLLLIVHD
jgi:hypothetical protein